MFNRDPSGKWPVVGQALDDWGKTARLAVLLIVMAICGVGPLVLIGWFLMRHGFSPTEVTRVIGGWFSR